MKFKELDVINTELAEDMSDDYYAHDPVTLDAFKYKAKYPNYIGDDFGTALVEPTAYYRPYQPLNFNPPVPNADIPVLPLPHKEIKKIKRQPIITPEEKEAIKSKLNDAVKEINKISDNVENKIMGLPKKKFWIGFGILALVVGGILISKK